MKIDADILNKINSGAHRQALIESGLYAIPTHKVHRNKKKYTRKSKHKRKDCYI